ncbi:dephospho-CoA kinase [Oxalicibacterium faecigallinarum]|uniref:Dephospho-CoA kinase n=1 Tax=Oxalicibacterium faecigallinarum TaxID=573741 RepID=A0A8J3F6Y6_9BURK|nr:dephospho-CoA kinase [Oxalicibacterium faecigallinarum]
MTGGIGSGKSTVADLFAKLGASIVDTDLIAHQLTAPEGLAIEPIRQAFGTAFIAQDGALDRKKMRDAVFGDPTQKKLLESILHPLIRIETERAARQASGTYVIFVVPLLVESGTWIQRVSRVLVVDCPEEVQRQRVMQRSGLSEAQVNAIMASQASRADRLAAADDIILNDGDSSLLPAAVERLHSRYQALALEASGL